MTDAGFFELDATIKRVAGGLGIAALGYDTVIGTLSGGQRAKLMLARLLLEQPDVMLLDEPTNFLDIEHIEWLTEYLNSVKKTFMVISHDTAFLDKVCKFIVSIENGSIKKYGGNYTTYIAQAEQNAKQYEESYRRQQEEIKRMEDYIARNKARAATAGMANSRKKMLDRMEKLDKPSVIYDAQFSFPCEVLHTRDMLNVDRLLIGYTSPLLPPINLHVEGDTKLWIRGTNGIGKTTLLNILAGIDSADSGSVRFLADTNVTDGRRVSMVFQEDRLLDSFDAYTNIRAVYGNTYDTGFIRKQFEAVGLADYEGKPVLKLSGGMKRRIAIVRAVLSDAPVLLLDEPFKGLDELIKEQTLRYINRNCRDKMIILVTHDRTDILKMNGVELELKNNE